jgi:Planctomycete cytochrome C
MRHFLNHFKALPIVITVFLACCDSQQSEVARSDHSESAREPVSNDTKKEAVQISMPEKISFNEHVQPILSEYCYHCHGPDSGTREPKSEPLRLDRVEDAFKVREDGKSVIIRGNAKDSAIVKRIHEKDPDSIMPPPESHKVMKPQEIAVLERWIDQGGEYEPHWSFAAVRRPVLPETSSPRNWKKSHFK